MGGTTSTIRVDTEAIARAITMLNGKIVDYEAHYTTIYQHLDEISAEWKGTDFDRFKQRLDGFKGDFIDLHKKLNDYVKFLNTAKTEYEAAQEKLTQSAGKLAADR